MYFEHNYMNIDAILLVPDSNQVEISREKNMTNDNAIRLTVSFEVHTYYPAFRNDIGNDIIDPRRTRWYLHLIEARSNSKPSKFNNNDSQQLDRQVEKKEYPK